MDTAEHRPQISTELLTCDALEAANLHEVRCADCGRCGMDNKVMRDDLERFTARVLMHYRVPEPEARITARVLVSADLRGIASHGVARLGRYIAGLEAGYIRPNVEFDIHESAPVIAAIDAKNGIGQVVSETAMDLAIKKAKENGIGMVTVRNSNHYGIAGYYVLKALEHRMIGISMTNAAPLVIPTHGASAALGTNPIAFGAPASRHRPFLLDTATSVVPRGKLEVYDRNRNQLPVGWAADEKGFDCQNPGRVLRNLLDRTGGGILPLGGRGEQFGGHKGYGFAAMVDILSGVLSGSAFGTEVNNLNRQTNDDEIPAPRVGHFFVALDIGRFMDPDEFEARMDEFIDRLKTAPKALDRDEIFVHGEKEFIRTDLHLKSGIPLADNVFDTLKRIADDCGIDPPPTVADLVANASPAPQQTPAA
jgi:LDH2 family malate/lactate/ureidoglycolate dehydrogenase